MPERAGVTREDSLMVAKWPAPQSDREYQTEVQGMDALIELITAVRSIRSEYNVQPGKEIDVVITNPSAARTAPMVEERAGSPPRGRRGKCLHRGATGKGPS